MRVGEETKEEEGGRELRAETNENAREEKYKTRARIYEKRRGREEIYNGGGTE